MHKLTWPAFHSTVFITGRELSSSNSRFGSHDQERDKYRISPLAQDEAFTMAVTKEIGEHIELVKQHFKYRPVNRGRNVTWVSESRQRSFYVLCVLIKL